MIVDPMISPSETELLRAERLRWISEMVAVMLPPSRAAEFSEIAAEVDRRLGPRADWKLLVGVTIARVVSDGARRSSIRRRHERAAARREAEDSSPLHRALARELVSVIRAEFLKAAKNGTARRLVAAAFRSAENTGTVVLSALARDLGISPSYCARLWRETLEGAAELLRRKELP